MKYSWAMCNLLNKSVKPEVYNICSKDCDKLKYSINVVILFES